MLANVLLVVALGLLYLLGATPIFAGICLAAWGMMGLGLVPALQLRIISLAGEGRDLAATLGASAVNLGIAVGSLIGGAVIADSGVRSVVLVALLICTAAIPGTWASQRLNVAPASDSSPARRTAGAIAADTDVAATGACCATAVVADGAGR